MQTARTMIDRLTSWLSDRMPQTTAETPPADPLALSATALLLEMARMDDHIDRDERSRIAELVRWKFNLDDTTAAALIAEAEAKSAASGQWYGYTSAIVDRTEPEDRVQIVELLWDVAYADGVLHDLEASLVRRIAGLLYVSDKDSGAARQRVLERYGLTGP